MGGLVWLGPSPDAHAAEPRLDEIAAARGIGSGELGVGRRDVVPAGAGAERDGRGAERRNLSLHGIPVRGAFETVWRATDGSERVVASRYPGRDAKLRPAQSQIDGLRARELAAPRLRPDQQARGLEAIEAELVYLLVFDEPILVWELTAPLSAGTPAAPNPSRLRMWVSAATGQVLEEVELVDLDNLTEVYGVNPQQTPTPSLVTLTNLDPEPPPWAEDMIPETGHLTGTRVRVFNCIDAEDGPFAPWRSEDECYPTQRVSADENGDYFVPLPNVTLIEDNRDPTDLYAELAMYWHAEKFFSFMAELGVTDFPCERSNMVANFHWLEPAPGYPELSYGPLNNAYYSGVCDIEDGPTMLFGQGSSVDFAFDGDVVYHELGHGIVELLTPEGLRQYRYREDGVLRDARAINEALADYHSLMVTERPELAEYVGFYWPDLGRPWIRNAENDAVCPRDMAGQEHNDSAPVSAALWAARRRVGPKLDSVVLAALPLLAFDATIEELAAALLSVAAAEREAGAWTASDYDQLERALAARNLLDCERVVDDPASLDDPTFLYLRNNGDFVSPFWPGPVQYRQVIPEGADNLLLTFEVQSEGNSAGQPVDYDVEPWLLVKRTGLSEDAPLHFEYELSALGSHQGEDGNLDSTWLVTGDWDEIYTPTILGAGRRQVLIRGLEPGEAVHVSFVNDERVVVVVSELRFTSVPTEELDEGSKEHGADGDEGAEGPGVDEGSSCACTTRPGGGKRGVLIPGLLVLLGLGRRRFRSRE